MGVFVAVVEGGSLSAAARRRNTSLATISRQLATLEDHVGARLIERTTRQMNPTESGRTYFERCKRILGEVEEAEGALSSVRSVPSGVLAVSAPILFGDRYLAPLLPEFLRRFSKVSVELSLLDRYVNLVEEAIDVAIRIGMLTDSSLVARRLGAFRRVVCAAPDYLHRLGEPRSPSDLSDHDCILFTALVDATHWHFLGPDGRETNVRVGGRLAANNADAALHAALGGAGLVLAPSWQVRDHVRAGRLKVVLRAYEPPEIPIHILYPQARLLSAKVRAFIDFLTEAWRAEDFARLDPPP